VLLIRQGGSHPRIQNKRNPVAKTEGPTLKEGYFIHRGATKGGQLKDASERLLNLQYPHGMLQTVIKALILWESTEKRVWGFQGLSKKGEHNLLHLEYFPSKSTYNTV